MKQENIDYLEQHKPVWDMLKNAGVLKHIDSALKDGLLKIIREEFNPGYIINPWCGTCVAEMITFVYTQYEKYLAGKK